MHEPEINPLKLPAPAGPPLLPQTIMSHEQLLQAISSARSKTAAALLPPQETAQILKTRFQALNITHTFQLGQLVQWKQGLKNRLRPESGQPAVVVEIFDAPIFDAHEQSASPYFREPLDLVLGVLMPEDAGFTLFYFDKRRFEPFVTPA